jgi:membrane associated rhomboid family serine protease
MNFGVSNPFANLPIVTKNLLIVNAIMLLATFACSSAGINLAQVLGLHHWSSDLFRPHQIITYMFMHGGIAHLFFNMFALYMFGKILIQLLVTELRIQSLINDIDPMMYQQILDEGLSIRQMGKNYIDSSSAEINNLINISTVGASGAVFGILLAFGMLFPNTQLQLIIPPVALKAKYFVLIYGAIELYQGVANNPNDNIAHFAHLGGMLFGFILIKFWKTNTTNF